MPDVHNRPHGRTPEESSSDLQSAQDRQRGYRVTRWRTFDNYECVHCQYSTLWLPKMQKHLSIGQHLWAYPVEKSDKTLSAPMTTDGLEY